MAFQIPFFLMKFLLLLFCKTALHIAVQKGNPEMVQLLLSRPEIDVNLSLILQKKYFNTI